MHTVATILGSAALDDPQLPVVSVRLEAAVPLCWWLLRKLRLAIQGVQGSSNLTVKCQVSSYTKVHTQAERV